MEVVSGKTLVSWACVLILTHTEASIPVWLCCGVHVAWWWLESQEAVSMPWHPSACFEGSPSPGWELNVLLCYRISLAEGLLGPNMDVPAIYW